MAAGATLRVELFGAFCVFLEHAFSCGFPMVVVVLCVTSFLAALWRHLLCLEWVRDARDCRPVVLCMRHIGGGCAGRLTVRHACWSPSCKKHVVQIGVSLLCVGAAIRSPRGWWDGMALCFFFCSLGLVRAWAWVLWPTIGWHVHMEFKSCVPAAIRDWCVLPGLCPECTCPWSEEQHPLRAAHSLLRKDSSILGHWHTCRHHLNAPFPSPLVVAEPGCC